MYIDSEIDPGLEIWFCAEPQYYLDPEEGDEWEDEFKSVRVGTRLPPGRNRRYRQEYRINIQGAVGNDGSTRIIRIGRGCS